jgi:hypothetical protein
MQGMPGTGMPAGSVHARAAVQLYRLAGVVDY